MALSWNEIKDRALHFSKEWADTSNEEADAKPFLVEFFNVFGIAPSGDFGALAINSFPFNDKNKPIFRSSNSLRFFSTNFFLISLFTRMLQVEV